MDRETSKFAEISEIFSQFTETNKQNLITTAQSLLKIQHASEAMITSNKPNESFGSKPEKQEL